MYAFLRSICRIHWPRNEYQSQNGNEEFMRLIVWHTEQRSKKSSIFTFQCVRVQIEISKMGSTSQVCICLFVFYAGCAVIVKREWHDAFRWSNQFIDSYLSYALCTWHSRSTEHTIKYLINDCVIRIEMDSFARCWSMSCSHSLHSLHVQVHPFNLIFRFWRMFVVDATSWGQQISNYLFELTNGKECVCVCFVTRGAKIIYQLIRLCQYKYQ